VYDAQLCVTVGDSIACRTYHSGAPAKADAVLHCSHASPAGAGVCAVPPPTNGDAGQNTNVGVVAGDTKAGDAANYCQIDDKDYRCEIGLNEKMKLAWKFDEAKDSASFRVVSKGRAWVALGISKESDADTPAASRMSGTWAVIGKPGISVAPYIINGYSQFTPNDATISASEVTQVPLADGTVNTVMTFTIEKMSAITPGYKINSKASNMVKFAHGIGNVFDGVTPHLTKGAVEINWASGGAAFTNTDFDPRLLKAHAVLMTLSWGILLPFGVLIAMTCRDVPPKGWWFKMHRVIQSTGLLVAIMAFIIVIQMVQKKNPDGHYTGPHEAHMVTGLVVMIIGILQPLNAFIRPHATPDRHDSSGRFVGAGEKTMGRAMWEFVHKGLGRFAVVVGPLNVWGGLQIIDKASFTALLGNTFQTGLSYFFFVGIVSCFAFAFFMRGQKAGGYKSVQGSLERIARGGVDSGVELGSISEEKGAANKRVSLSSTQAGQI
jgi:hypothetical protein